MKKVASIVASVAIIAAATAASAITIVGTKHDLSSGGGKYNSSPTDQVCVFCHTPHNAAQNIPLWNRSNPAGAGFSLYSSPTMKNNYGGTTGFTADSISLFCMSCHDGTTLLGGKVKNQAADWTSANVTNAGGTVAADKIASGDALIGSDLMNDHPVNFNITDVTGLGTVTAGKMKTSSVTNGFPLFKSGRGSQSLECSSCHAVHDNAEAPFLRTTNAGSKLCLGCHVK